MMSNSIKYTEDHLGRQCPRRSRRRTSNPKLAPNDLVFLTIESEWTMSNSVNRNDGLSGLDRRTAKLLSPVLVSHCISKLCESFVSHQEIGR